MIHDGPILSFAGKGSEEAKEGEENEGGEDEEDADMNGHAAAAVSGVRHKKKLTKAERKRKRDGLGSDTGKHAGQKRVKTTKGGGKEFEEKKNEEEEKKLGYMEMHPSGHQATKRKEEALGKLLKW